MKLTRDCRDRLSRDRSRSLRGRHRPWPRHRRRPGWCKLPLNSNPKEGQRDATQGLQQGTGHQQSCHVEAQRFTKAIADRKVALSELEKELPVYFRTLNKFNVELSTV